MSTVNEILNHISGELNDSFSSNEKVQISKMFVMDRMNMEKSDLVFQRNKQVPEHVLKNILRDIHKINKGEPLQYVLGTTYFYGLPIKTDKRALIPRPETEELVDWIVKEYKGKSPKILDVGTGTGCIPLALKSALPGADVRAIDVSRDALDLAKENAERLKLNVRFDIGTALNLEDYSRYKWDVIVSNPPYIPNADKASMQAHVVGHEPHTALFVPDNDPLLFYKPIAQYAKEYLVPNGDLFFEINENYNEEVKEILNLLGFSKIEDRKDLQGKDRMIRATV